MKKILFGLLFILIAIPASAKMLYEYGTFSQRAEMAVEYGIVENTNEYSGSYDQNVQLLNYLEGGYDTGMLGANPFQPSGISINIRQNLTAGASRTGTTLNIDPMITLDGHRLAFSDFNTTKAYAKIDQGTDNEEIFSFTGITDNTSYYTLTGCDWGYNFYNTATSTANIKRHLSGANLIITNDWHFVDSNYVSLGSAQTITAIKTFANTTYPRLDTYLAPTNNEDFAPKKYVDDVAIAGAPDGTETVKGIWEGATQAEMAAGTATGGTGAGLVLQSKYATSTPSTGQYIPVTEADGDIAQTFLPLDENLTFSGSNSFATTTFTVIPTIPTSSPSTAGQVIGLDSSSKLPAVDGSQLTNLPNSYFVGIGVGTVDKTYFNYILPWIDHSDANVTDHWTFSSVTSYEFAFYYGIINTSDDGRIYATIRNEIGDVNAFSNKTVIVEFSTKCSAVGKGDSEMAFGLFNGAPSSIYNYASQDAATFTIDDSGNLYAHTSDGSGTINHTETQITGITLTDKNLYRIEWTPATDAKFYINGVLEATITTTLPNSGNVTIGFANEDSADEFSAISQINVSIER